MQPTGQEVIDLSCCTSMCHVSILLRRSLPSESRCIPGTILTHVRPAPSGFAACTPCNLQSTPDHAPTEFHERESTAHCRKHAHHLSALAVGLSTCSSTCQHVPRTGLLQRGSRQKVGPNRLRFTAAMPQCKSGHRAVRKIT